jgi:hypothetical protein
MTTHLTAEEITVTSDERGWELHIDTDQGALVVNIHGVAWDFAEDVRQIQRWRAEGEAARATMPPRITQEDLEAYEPGDPKRIGLQRIMDEQR